MHLHHPSLSTTGKKKGKKKFASAEHARRAREQEVAWKELQKKWAIEAQDKKRNRGLTAPALSTSSYNLRIPEGRDTTAHIKSVDTGGGSTAPPPLKVYTGNKCLGISTLHKSNAVPVFRQEDIIDIAHMRR